jgi:hypothetical protein
MKIFKSFIIFGEILLPENTLECHKSVAEDTQKKDRKLPIKKSKYSTQHMISTTLRCGRFCVHHYCLIRFSKIKSVFHCEIIVKEWNVTIFHSRLVIMFGITVILWHHPYGVLRSICQPSIFKVPALSPDVPWTYYHLWHSFFSDL